MQFTDLSKDATEWKWDLGDGSSSKKQNPTHAYSETGIYTVRLTASNSNGTDSQISTVNVVLKGSPTPSYAYITGLNSNTVSVFNTGNNTLAKTVPVGNDPMGVAISGWDKSICHKYQLRLPW